VRNIAVRTWLPEHGLPEHGLPEHGLPEHGLPEHATPNIAIAPPDGNVLHRRQARHRSDARDHGTRGHHGDAADR
jgi:hypothetical protein